MSYHQPTPRAGRRPRSTVLPVVVVVAALAVVVLSCRSLPGSSSAASPIDAKKSAHRSHERVRGGVPGPMHGGLHGQTQGDHPHALGLADGEVPDGVTVFDDEYPAVTNLDSALLRALRQAATDAGRDGVEFYVNSGWRSPAYQEELLDEAVSEYGSRAEAARWVATPTTSPHVSGDAVDIGDTDATAWLSEHGSEYALCQIYGNEPWHFELRPEAVIQGCPPLYADPTQDPRMRQDAR